MAQQRILYLDQNKWIEIARAIKDPDSHQEIYSVLELLVQATNKGELLIPLSGANIYETHKVNDPLRRGHLAWVQASLSQGTVFRGRDAILRAQIAKFLSRILGVPFPKPAVNWFISENPFEFAGESLEKTLGRPILPEAIRAIKENPAAALHSFLTDIPDENRRVAVERWTAASDELLVQMKKRRKLVQDQPLTIQIRAYAAQLMLEHRDFIFGVAAEFGIPVANMRDLSDRQWRAMITDVGLFDIERELSTKLEYEDRVVDENDIRDVWSFTTAICLADVVLGEAATIGSAKQAKLGQKYSVALLTSFRDLRLYLHRIAQ